MDWKPFIRRITYWTVPSGIQDVIRRKRQGLISEFCEVGLKSEFARNKKFFNLHRGKRCFILGSGPSINKQNLRPLKDEICFAISRFYLHKDIKEINPMYHVDAPNHPPYDFNIFKTTFESFKKYYSERTIYFLGHLRYEYSIFNFLKQNPSLKKGNIYYLNYCRSPELNDANYNNPDIWDISKILFLPRSGLYCAIQVAAYMGFRHIYLLGCDHDYLMYFNRLTSEHFYTSEDGYGTERPSTEKHLFINYLHWQHYRLMRTYLEPQGSYIYNATEGGLLDVFPRLTLADALSASYEKSA